MGMFARLAQAINLLDQVLKHVAEENTSRDEALYSARTLQLDRTIRSLANLTKSESHFRQTEACLQTSMCYRYSHLHAYWRDFSANVLTAGSWPSTIWNFLGSQADLRVAT
jgi:hypothetical protein